MLLIITSCETVKCVEVPVEVEYDLKDPPAREELPPREEGMTFSQHLFARMTYYSDLVEQWESWGLGVYEALDQDIPESLESVKKQTEDSE